MIGKLIGAVAGSQIAQSTRGGVGGPAGAAIGFIAPAVLRRMSLPMMALLGFGGYMAKKHFDEQKGETDAETVSNTPEQPVVSTRTPGTV
ncbi:MAG: hypothetical protein WA908_05585 [Pontixanthobacter sp.]